MFQDITNMNVYIFKLIQSKFILVQLVQNITVIWQATTVTVFKLW